MSTDLERYAAIGDMRTLGLVDDGGSLDWWCWPRFDSPSVFGRLLDDDGGHWQIEPTETVVAHRHVYLSGTNVLVTRMHTETGVLEIDDLMAVGDTRLVIRRARCVRGTVALRSTMIVRPDYGRADARFSERDGEIRIDVGEVPPLVATASVELAIDGDTVRGECELGEGESAWFTLGADGHTALDVGTVIDDTVDYWQLWTAQSTYRGRWREAVERSALVLKLLTSIETGGLIAAGTTSLPEVAGGERNWDYRYVWIRDAAFTLYAFLELGYTSEAAAFTEWLTDRLEACADRCTATDRPPLSPLYDLDGNDDLGETNLDHWSGYADSRPVRIGNAASSQAQLDIYGELIDSVYIADKQSDGVSIATWRHVRTLVDWVVDHWDEPDDGMWEARSGPRRYTSSLLMCWVAVERAMRMARRRGRPGDLVTWQRARDEMHATLVDRGFSDDLQAFTQTLDGETLDASILLMPLVKFIAPTDPMWRTTLDAIGNGLAHGPLVDRYDPSVTDDGLDGDEGSFTICSFWYVEAMSRSGRVEEARRHFDRLLTYATPTGLFSEEIGPNGRLLGNFPQAFTHLALISAAVSLNETLEAGSTT
ncbi:MAG: glycoside hydrolase family 15 protein [Ilumatobacteraceae bacterium]|nr:glycoside hydrolase family 15 protein [Ilumatobacteraceae bacterium]